MRDLAMRDMAVQKKRNNERSKSHMKAYKGFNEDMTCTPKGKKFQFEEGKTYEEPEANLCNSGFHACEHPLGCFGHYAPNKSVYHEVELEDVDPKREMDTKCAGKKITIGAKLDIAGMVKAAVDFVFAKVDWENAVERATGRYGAASATGYQGVACALGIRGKAKAVHGGWIICAEWKEVEPYEWDRIDVRSAKVDGETIKADTWYKLENGEFVEVG